MTFKDLQKAVQSQQSGPELSTIPKDIPFWIFDREQHRLEDIRTKGQCCYWHVIKPPQKDGKDMPVLPYQKPQLTKRKSVLKTPGPNVDFYGNVIGIGDTIPIAIIDVSSTSYKKQKLPAAYEALRKQGYTFTDYEER